MLFGFLGTDNQLHFDEQTGSYSGKLFSREQGTTECVGGGITQLEDGGPQCHVAKKYFFATEKWPKVSVFNFIMRKIQNSRTIKFHAFFESHFMIFSFV